MKTMNGKPLTLVSEADESMGKSAGNFSDVKHAIAAWEERRGTNRTMRGNFNFRNTGLRK